MDHEGGGYQTGPRHVPGAPSGPQRSLDPGGPSPSGAQQVLGPGSGAQPALGRDPARGFPPGRTLPPQAEGNGYSPVSGYRQHDWLNPDENQPPAGEHLPEPPDGPGPGPGPGRRDRSPGRRWLRRPVVLGAAGVLVLAALAVAGVLVLGKHTTSSGGIHPGTSLALPTSDPTANSPYFSAKLGKWQHIGSRKLDPTALTANELYPPVFKLSSSPYSYTRAAASVDKNCTLAVFGPQLQTALQSGKCTQVVRATYLSGDGKIMGTIGVVNLSTAQGAQQAGQVTGADELVAPLSTSKGPAKNLLSGTGVVYAEVKGHYLILMYAEFTSLKSPSTTAQKQQLVDFTKGMFAGSANIALSNRMIYGKP